jgi:hypothetical protein
VRPRFLAWRASRPLQSTAVGPGLRAILWHGLGVREGRRACRGMPEPRCGVCGGIVPLAVCVGAASIWVLAALAVAGRLVHPRVCGWSVVVWPVHGSGVR